MVKVRGIECNLLGLDVVRRITARGSTPFQEPRPGKLTRPPRNQRHKDLASENVEALLCNISMNDVDFPVIVHFLDVSVGLHPSPRNVE
jgi:hypothetical protein